MDITTVTGAGAEGSITAQDIEKQAAQTKTSAPPATVAVAAKGLDLNAMSSITRAGEAMTAPIEKAIREVVLRALGNVAPEVDLDSINPSKDLRDPIDIDSVDFLNFVIGLHEELHIEIPDADVVKLTTLDGCVAYLRSRNSVA